MSKFEDLKSKISTVLMHTEVYQHGSSLVPKPNEKELVARLKPEQQGEERGTRNLPPVEATQFDEVEQKIIDTMQEMVDTTTKDVNEALKTYNDRLSSLSMVGKLDGIHNICKHAISEFVAEVSDGKNSLLSFADEVKNRENDLQEFKRENRLRRSANYPDTGEKFLRYGLIVFLFAVELVANSVYLSKSNEMGIIGAATEAFYISLLNIGSALLLGKLVTRYMNHRVYFLKILSAVVTIIFLGFAVCFNLLVAHYREVSGTGLFGSAGSDAIASIKSSPLGLESIEGWMLFLVGLLFWLVSVIDAHGLDDNYPGYGAVDRRAKQTRDDYSGSFRKIVDELSDKRDDGQREITELRDEMDEVLAKIGTLKNARKTLLSDYELFKQQTVNICLRVVEKYRSANRSVRDEVPNSFQQTPSLVFVTDFSALNDSFNVDSELESVRIARESLDESIEKFYHEFKENIQGLEPLSTVLGR